MLNKKIIITAGIILILLLLIFLTGCEMRLLPELPPVTIVDDCVGAEPKETPDTTVNDAELTDCDISSSSDNTPFITRFLNPTRQYMLSGVYCGPFGYGSSVYSDYGFDAVSTDDTTIVLNGLHCDNGNVNFLITVSAHDVDTDVTIDNAYIASLANCQKIPVTVSPDNMRVAAGTSSAVIVSADIPTDLEDERYMLYIDICGVTYRYYFFSDPSIPWSHIQM